MKLQRRDFLIAGSAGVAASTLGLSGCSASSWITIAINDLPTILQIVTTIISIVGAASGSADAGAVTVATNAANQALADLKEVELLIQGYQTAPSASVLAKIDAGLMDVQTNLAGLLTAFHISNPVLQATLAAAIGSALTILVALQALIPAPATSSALRVELHKAAASSNNALVLKRSFNESVAAAGSPQFAIS